jgi:transcription antitermination factor NusG
LSQGTAIGAARILRVADFSAIKQLPDYLPRWYAVFTTPRHEKRVASHFAQRELEGYLPLYHAVHKWKNRCKVSLELPLFPNYIFVHMDWRERVRVLEVPGVSGVVGTRPELSAISDRYVESLREGLLLQKIEPHPYLVIGERVRIKEGAMAGMEGVLVRKKAGFRVVLTLDTIMQSIAVEVDADQVEPAGPKPIGGNGEAKPDRR